MATKCPKCQFDNPPETIYCGKCGTRIQGTRTDGDCPRTGTVPIRKTSPNSVPVSITKTLETKPEGLGKGELFAGRFELIEELGSGGMGIVYRAYDKEVGEEIALKVLHPDIALDERTVERFRNEI